MKGRLKKIAIVVASALLVSLALQTWAAPVKRAAYVSVGDAVWRGASKLVRADKLLASRRAVSSKSKLPFAVRFREVEGRGLLVNAWINNSGPYTLAIDTGAGATILSERVAQAARVRVLEGRRPTTIGGLSGQSNVLSREATINSLAIGDKNNFLPSQSTVVVTNHLPEGVDGVLDPTESYWPLGYVIDLPNATLSAFDPSSSPLSPDNVPAGGAVVPWLTGGASRRPFVRLDNGRRALIDTGSGFGLALSEAEAQSMGIIPRGGRAINEVRDLGGGRVAAHRIAPLTVRIGSMTLRNVPTDLLSGVESGAPILLGRDALYPFKLAFDPSNRLIQISPR